MHCVFRVYSRAKAPCTLYLHRSEGLVLPGGMCECQPQQKRDSHLLRRGGRGGLFFGEEADLSGAARRSARAQHALSGPARRSGRAQHALSGPARRSARVQHVPGNTLQLLMFRRVRASEGSEPRAVRHVMRARSERGSCELVSSEARRLAQIPGGTERLPGNNRPPQQMHASLGSRNRAVQGQVRLANTQKWRTAKRLVYPG